MKKKKVSDKEIGIEFEYESSYELLLNDLFSNIDFSKYEVSIKQKEVIYEDEQEHLEYEMQGKKFNKAISNNGNYYVNYINLQIFPNDYNKNNIITYNDFLNSNCLLILLISDNNFIEIYFKSNDLKVDILKNIKEMNISYTIKTKDNDGRISMEV